MTMTERQERLSEEEIADLDTRIQFAPGYTHWLLKRALTELRALREAGGNFTPGNRQCPSCGLRPGQTYAGIPSCQAPWGGSGGRVYPIGCILRSKPPEGER